MNNTTISGWAYSSNTPDSALNDTDIHQDKSHKVKFSLSREGDDSRGNTATLAYGGNRAMAATPLPSIWTGAPCPVASLSGEKAMWETVISQPRTTSSNPDARQRKPPAAEAQNLFHWAYSDNGVLSMRGLFRGLGTPHLHRRRVSHCRPAHHCRGPPGNSYGSRVMINGVRPTQRRTAAEPYQRAITLTSSSTPTCRDCVSTTFKNAEVYLVQS